MEPLVQQAREAHRVSLEHSRLSAHHRERRDHAIRRLYATGGWSYSQLARQIGCSPELIAKIVTGRPERRPEWKRRERENIKRLKEVDP